MKVKDLLKNPKFLFTIFVFVYVIVVGIFIQFILFPYIFPKAHYKYGIFIKDTILFHEEAVRVAKEIESKGWQAWSLYPKPHGQIMVGITSFFYAITGIHKPYVMLFYNAILHALFALFLVKLLENLGVKTKFAILGALIVVLFPSTLIWIAQIHRDGLYILGFTLLFWSISEALKANFRSLVFSILGQAVGIGLIFLVRQHLLLAIRYIFASMIVLTLIVIGFYLVRKVTKLKTLSHFLVFSLVVFVYSNLLTFIPIKFAILDAMLALETETAKTEWVHQFFVPKKIDNIFRAVARWRYEFLNNYHLETPGTIEHDFMPNKATDFLFYIPRGLFVGLFLGPDFWFYWFVKGGVATGLFTRLVIPTETIIIFFALLSFPFAFYKLRNNPAFYIILLLCLVFIYLHVVTEPEVGAIVRKRYVFISFIVSLSFAYLLMWWFSWRAKRLS